jgi:hypothetical protein
MDGTGLRVAIDEALKNLSSLEGSRLIRAARL